MTRLTDPFPGEPGGPPPAPVPQPRGWWVVRRLAAAASAFLLTLGLLLTSAPPASATLAACPSGHVCFWNWVSFNNGGSSWSTHVQNAYGSACVTLPASMRDVTTSLAFNNASVGGAGHVRFYLWINCNAGGGYFTLSDTFTPQPDLNCPTFMPPCNDVYADNIASFDWMPS